MVLTAVIYPPGLTPLPNRLSGVPEVPRRAHVRLNLRANSFDLYHYLGHYLLSGVATGCQQFSAGSIRRAYLFRIAGGGLFADYGDKW
jgi:hypothetical protein